MLKITLNSVREVKGTSAAGKPYQFFAYNVIIQNGATMAGGNLVLNDQYKTGVVYGAELAMETDKRGNVTFVINKLVPEGK